ncbi:MAG: RNA polymerase sigma factor [Vicinamibacterales bacterium]
MDRGELGQGSRPLTACSSDGLGRHQQIAFSIRLAGYDRRGYGDARDSVQETFLRAARHPGSVPAGASSEEAWLVRVLINICRDGWRRQAVRNHAQIEPERNDPGHEEAVIARSLMHMALDRLPPRRRAILVVYEIDGTGIPEIAKLLGIAPVTCAGTCRGEAHRCRSF